MNPDSVIHINALNHFVASLFHDTVMNTCIYQFNWATVCPDIQLNIISGCVWDGDSR